METIYSDSSFTVESRKQHFRALRRFTMTQYGKKWTRSIEFLLTCIVSCGLGNIWRFPSVAYQNGGGAFLLSYIIIIIFVGKPLFYLEMAMGQFVGKRPIEIWDMAPALRGIGIGQIYAALATVSYYSTITALALYYLFKSFKVNIPWGHCQAEWESCFDSIDVSPHNKTFENGASSSYFYFRKVAIKEKSNIDDGIGAPDGILTLYLLGVWIILGFLIYKGVKSVGKMAYFAAIYPYIIFLVMLIASVRLPGAIDGIKFLFIPQWSQLLHPEVWHAAVVQVFFSLNISFGPVIYLSSHCEFKHTLNRDLCIITAMDILLSLMASIHMFSILGNLAHISDKDISNVVQGGMELTLIIYPDAITKFSNQPGLISALFFLMLLVVGIGSGMAIIGCCMSVILDKYPKLKIWRVTPIVCAIGFLSGIVYLTPGGMFVLQLVDHYVAAGVMYFLAIFQVIGIVWVYGLENFCKDITFMTKGKVNVFWRLCLGLITPLFLIIILICFYSVSSTITYQSVGYPTIAIVIGNLLTALGVIQICIWMIKELYRFRDKPFRTMVKLAFTPNAHYGPEDIQDEIEWKKYLQLIKREDWSDMALKEKFIYGSKVLLGMIKDDIFYNSEDDEEQYYIDLDYDGNGEDEENGENEISEQIEMRTLDDQNNENEQ